MVKFFVTSKSLLSCVLAVSLVFSSCASLTSVGIQTVKPVYYAQCYEHIDYIRQSESAVMKDTAQAAAIGAVSGAVIGGLVKGDMKGALLGAAAGGLAGGGFGYYKAKQDQAETDAERFSLYQKDINKDIADIDRSTLLAKMAFNCYKNEYDLLIQDIKDRKIEKEEALKRWNEIKLALIELSGNLEKTEERMKGNLKMYDEAVAQEISKENPESTSSSQTSSVAFENTGSDKKNLNSAYEKLSRKELISQIQKELKDLGFYKYKVDGITGPGTNAAIENFQKESEMPINTKITPQLLSDIINKKTESDTPRSSSVDNETMSVDLVEKVQSLLKDMDIYTGPVNGVADKNTESAIKQFQKMYDFEENPTINAQLVIDINQKWGERDIPESKQNVESTKERAEVMSDKIAIFSDITDQVGAFPSEGETEVNSFYTDEGSLRKRLPNQKEFAVNRTLLLRKTV